MEPSDLQKIQKLRKLLHENAEVSGQEVRTRNILKEFLQKNTSLELVDKGKWFYAVKRGSENGKRIAFRADMDAVSSPKGCAAHMCGHDGHSAVLAGFGLILERKQSFGKVNYERPDEEKSIFLLFQYGEETGEGAKECKAFLKEERIEEIYGFHNIPGEKRGRVLLRKNTFACSSKGMAIRFAGKPSHAAYPELGINPAFAMGEIISKIPSAVMPEQYKKMVLCTIIKVEAGDNAFGVSASRGELLLTIRGELEEDLKKLQNTLENLVKEAAEKEKLGYEIAYSEEFPATENDSACVETVQKACEKAGIPFKSLEEPFRWSEDFGHYLKETKGAFFGIGDGENYPGLHTEDYQFPDEILERAAEVFAAISEQ